MQRTVPPFFTKPTALAPSTILRYGMGDTLADFVDAAAGIPRGADVRDPKVQAFVDRVRVLTPARRSLIVHTLVRGMHSALLRALWRADLGDRPGVALVRLAVQRLALFGTEDGDPAHMGDNGLWAYGMGSTPQPHELLTPAPYLEMGDAFWRLAVAFRQERLAFHGAESVAARHLPADALAWLATQATRDPAIVAQNLFGVGLTTGAHLTWKSWEHPSDDSATVARDVLAVYQALGAFEYTQSPGYADATTDVMAGFRAQSAPGVPGMPKAPGAIKEAGIPDEALLTDVRHVLLAALAGWPLPALLPAVQRLTDPAQQGDAEYAPVFARITQAGVSIHERMQYSKRMFGLPERERLWAASGVLSLGQHLPYAQIYTIEAMRKHGILRTLFL